MRTTLTLLILTVNLLMYAQVDDEFWFAPPTSAEYTLGGTPAGIDNIEIIITAMQTTRVTIEQPATGWSFTTPVIGEMSNYSVNLGAVGLLMSDIITPAQTLPLDATFVPFKAGLKITSDPGLITVSYKLIDADRSEQFSLKGKNALGEEFYVSTQNAFPNETTNNYSGFTIVATEDATEIEIHRNDIWGNNPLAPAGPYPIIETINLNTGQTFTVRSLDNSVAHHINGVYVKSTDPAKPIAITYWDDMVEKRISAGTFKRDICGDQTIPISIAGTNYIIMKGGMFYHALDGGERFFITGITDGTSVEVFDTAGTLLETIAINAGEVTNREIQVETTYLVASNPIYVNHYTAVPVGKAAGASVLPPVGACTGSHDVVITRSYNNQDVFVLNILAENDNNPASPYYNKAAESFNVVTDDGIVHSMPSNLFAYSHDKSYIFAKKLELELYIGGLVDPGKSVHIYNRSARFHLGVIEGHKNRNTKYGYFSDYGGGTARAGVKGPNEDAREYLCNLNPIQLVAIGARTYEWSVIGDEAHSLDYLSALDIPNPIYSPDTFTTRRFLVKMSQQCGPDLEQILEVSTLPQPVAYFTTGVEEICSPDSILITEEVSQDNVDLYWYFNNTTISKVENTNTSTPFYRNLPINTSDTLVPYTVTLQANYVGACTDEYTKTVLIKPRIDAHFEFIGDSISCNPLSVELKNHSTGHLDSTSYLWLFGDNTLSYEIDSVTHTYFNYTTNPDTLTLQLLTRSPFDCMDTATKEVIVYPRVKALFSTTPNQACSPLIFDINPINSVGADSLFWNIDYFYNDSSFIRTDRNSISVTHYDNTVAAGPDTLNISLIAKNNYGCADTALPHQLIAFPSSIADFNISSDNICDADSIIFDNNSIGYNLDFYWSLGDGTAPNDSTPAAKPYYNPSSADITYPINLTVISDNNCIDSKDTLLTVHPYIDANFGINYIKNCSPLSVSITDNTFGADIFNWDLGDGDTYANSGNFTHTYTNPDPTNDTDYIIKLIVENNEGCADSITRILTVKPQVVAALNITNNLGCSPLSPSFENLSQGGSYYIWNLGGNNLRTDTAIVNFDKIYTNSTADDAIYPISLTAMNTAGCDSTVFDTVEVYADILTQFTFAKDSSCSPFLPVITNNSGGGAKVFEWYRDGVLFSSDNTPTLPTYTNSSDTPELYEYTLIAYGENDAPHKMCADTHSVNIKVFPHLTTTFTLDDLASCQPLNTGITNTSNLQDSSQFIWYLDNYIYSSAINPGNLFINNYSAIDATHTFKLTGRTNHGCTDTSSINVDVFAYINANFTIDKPSICSGDSFGINRYNTTGAIDTYLWDFDGVNSSRSDEQFNYSFDNTSSSPITKPITLTVSNANCDSTWSGSIQVNPLVTANFDAVVDSGCHPHTTAFNNSTINGNTFYWTFGDGVNSTDVDPVHTFNNYDPANNKSFDIRLISESNFRCRDTAFGKITSYAKPIANFIMPISVSCPPFDFSVINNSEGSNSLNYLWEFGNNTYIDFEPSETFDNTGGALRHEDIKLTVISENGCTDSISQEMTVYPRVNVDFSATPPTGCSPLEVDFTGDTLNVQQLVWYIDDKLFSAQVSPTKQFLNETGNDISHDIKLKAYSRYNCVDSSEGSVTVYATPRSDFSLSPIPVSYDTINDQTTLTLTNYTKNQTSWDYIWEFGDGKSGINSERLFTHNYDAFFWGPKENNFRIPVTLVSSNPRHPACKDTIQHEAILLPPIPLVDVGEEIAGCIPLSIDFSAYTKYANSDSYQWNFGDGSSINTDITPTHTFNEAGTYTVILNVEGDGGPAADYKIITVFPQPIANFSFNDTVVFVASQTKDDDWVNFYNQTKYGTSYEWYFDEENFLAGSGPDSDQKDPLWAYDEIGTYKPVLVAYSGHGCSDTLVSSKQIRVLGEGILQFPTGFYVDPGSTPADEYNTSQITPNMYVFYPRNSGIAEYKLEVYNRWGTLVFETDDVNRGWNGYFDGVIAKQDVYIWRAKGYYTNGQPYDISGDVTLFQTPVNTNP